MTASLQMTISKGTQSSASLYSGAQAETKGLQCNPPPPPLTHIFCLSTTMLNWKHGVIYYYYYSYFIREEQMLQWLTFNFILCRPCDIEKVNGHGKKRVPVVLMGCYNHTKYEDVWFHSLQKRINVDFYDWFYSLAIILPWMHNWRIKPIFVKSFWGELPAHQIWSWWD